MTDTGLKRCYVFLWGTLLSVAMISGSLAAGEIGRCYRAEIADRMVLPDGKDYDPAQLRICTTSEFTPVIGLHRISVNGAHIGAYFSRFWESPAAKSETRPFFIFFRNDRDELVLYGYAVPKRQILHTYVFPGRARVKSTWRVADKQHSKEEGNENWVLVFADY